MIGAYAVERDYSHYVAYATKTVLAVISTATKGPIGKAVACTSTQDLVNKFGPLNPECYGLYAGQYFLSQASQLFFIRAAGDSAAAGSFHIKGKNASSTEIEDAIIFEMDEKGTYSDGYKLYVTVDEEDNYDFQLKSNYGVVLDTLKGIALEKLIEGYETTHMKIKTVNPQTASLVAGTYMIVSGNNGFEDVEAGDYINAAQAILADTVDVNLISVPGISDPSVITAILTVAETKGDCFYLIDPPRGLTRDGVIQWVNGDGAYEHSMLNSSYGGVYYDWVTIYDSYNKVKLQVPPSVVVGEVYAYSDRNSDLWYAPAGLTRGLLRGVLETVTKLSKTDVQLLYESNINSIYDDPQVGPVLWGQKTLFREDTALNRVNVRRLLNYLKKVITAACNYLTFEPNDRITWNSFEMKIIPTLDSVKNRRGIYEYKVVRGETIVTDQDIDNYKMPCMVMIRPTKAAEEIPIYFVVTSSGADFNEVLDSNGVIVSDEAGE